MTQQYPSNSKGGKDRPVVKQVTQNPVKQREKSMMTRVGEAFKGDSAKSVGDFVVFDVLIPMVKTAIFDSVTQGFERALLGNVRRSPSGYRPAIRGQSYDAPYRPSFTSSSPYTSSSRTPVTAPSDFKEVLVATRIEGEKVLDLMSELLDRYGLVRVSDFNAAVGITGSFTDEKWGWTELRNTSLRRVYDGYLVIMPNPVPID